MSFGPKLGGPLTPIPKFSPPLPNTHFSEIGIPSPSLDSIISSSPTPSLYPSGMEPIPSPSMDSVIPKLEDLFPKNLHKSENDFSNIYDLSNNKPSSGPEPSFIHMPNTVQGDIDNLLNNMLNKGLNNNYPNNESIVPNSTTNKSVLNFDLLGNNSFGSNYGLGSQSHGEIKPNILGESKTDSIFDYTGLIKDISNNYGSFNNSPGLPKSGSMSFIDLPYCGVQLHMHQEEGGANHFKKYGEEKPFYDLSSYDAAMADILADKLDLKRWTKIKK
jgi:hypothetical protein